MCLLYIYSEDVDLNDDIMRIHAESQDSQPKTSQNNATLNYGLEEDRDSDTEITESEEVNVKHTKNREKVSTPVKSDAKILDNLENDENIANNTNDNETLPTPIGNQEINRYTKNDSAATGKNTKHSVGNETDDKVENNAQLDRHLADQETNGIDVVDKSIERNDEEDLEKQDDLEILDGIEDIENQSYIEEDLRRRDEDHLQTLDDMEDLERHDDVETDEDREQEDENNEEIMRHDEDFEEGRDEDLEEEDMAGNSDFVEEISKHTEIPEELDWDVDLDGEYIQIRSFVILLFRC